MLTWLNQETLLKRGESLLFIEFTEPGGSPVWNPLLGLTCGQEGWQEPGTDLEHV